MENRKIMIMSCRYVASSGPESGARLMSSGEKWFVLRGGSYGILQTDVEEGTRSGYIMSGSNLGILLTERRVRKHALTRPTYTWN